MTASAHVIDLRHGSDLPKVCQTTAVNHGHAEIVDQLLGDEDVRVPNRVEDFSNRNWRSRMLPDGAEAFLQFRGNWVFQPEQVIWLEALSQSCCLDWRQPVVNVVKQVQVIAKFQPQGFKELGNVQ